MNRYAMPAIVLLGLLVRLPFWVEAIHTPLDGDTAIIGLMARHPFASTTMWGQPYGSPVEAWLAAPILALFGATPAALRLVYFLLGLALIPASAWLASALDRRAALPAALLAACPSPYFLLLSALPPPLYPTALLLGALALGLLLRLAAAASEGRAVRPLVAAAAGLAAGLAVWTHLMMATVIGVALVHLARRSRARRVWIPLGLALAAASAPLWIRALGEAGALRVVSVSGRDEGMREHLRAVVPELHRPVTGLLGAHVPWIADDPDHLVYAPTGVAFTLIALHGSMLLAAVRSGGLRGAPGALLAMVVLVILVFPFPIRSSPGAIRFLTPAYLPLVALVCWVGVVKGNVRRAVIVALTLGMLNLVVGARLLQAWRTADRAKAPFLLPDLEPLRAELEARGLRRVYASYGHAYRLTFESGERVIASQPWNERFLHHPLPYLDEVRFARHVGWVLFPGAPDGLPGPDAFEEQLRAAGGRWEKTEAGRAALFHAFAPPFAPTVVPLASAGPGGDGNVETPAVGEGAVTWALSPPRALSAVTLVAPPAARLPRGFDLEVSADGVGFERVARRRRREERRDLRWVNGHPQYVIDDDLVSVPLAGRQVAAVRLTPMETEPWTIGEVLLHEPGNPAPALAPWDEWLDPNLDWPARRAALEGNPQPERVDWHYRRRLAGRRR